MEKINFEMEWVASRVFSDEHAGGALTPGELEMRANLEEAYKDEINTAKAMLQNNQDFANLSYEKKLAVAANLISEIKNQKEQNIKTR